MNQGDTKRPDGRTGNACDAADHPPDPVITSWRQAAFWHSPSFGLFRARVMPWETPSATVHLYNRLNATALRASDDPARQPQPLSDHTVAATPTIAPVAPGRRPGEPRPVVAPPPAVTGGVPSAAPIPHDT